MSNTSEGITNKGQAFEDLIIASDPRWTRTTRNSPIGDLEFTDPGHRSIFVEAKGTTKETGRLTCNQVRPYKGISLVGQLTSEQSSHYTEVMVYFFSAIEIVRRASFRGGQHTRDSLECFCLTPSVNDDKLFIPLKDLSFFVKEAEEKFSKNTRLRKLLSEHSKIYSESISKIACEIASILK